MKFVEKNNRKCGKIETRVDPHPSEPRWLGCDPQICICICMMKYSLDISGCHLSPILVQIPNFAAFWWWHPYISSENGERLNV